MEKKGYYLKRYLNQKLQERCLTNPAYSLRAFAKALDCDASSLSKYLSGQRIISKRFYLQVKEKLKLSPPTLEQFEDEQFKLELKSTYFMVNRGTFTQLGELKAAVLVELLTLTTIEASIKNLSNITKESEEEISSILSNLEKIQLVECVNGVWKRKFETVSYQLKSSAEEGKKASVKLAELLLQSLHSPPKDQAQLHTTAVITTDSLMIAEAKVKIKDFALELMRWLETSPTKDSTFCLYLSMFPLIRTESLSDITDNS